MDLDVKRQDRPRITTQEVLLISLKLYIPTARKPAIQQVNKQKPCL